MISKQEIEEALDWIDTHKPEATGYHILVKPLPTREGFEKAEAELAPTLAASGFKLETDDQKQREDKGNHYHLVVDVGSIAYKSELLGSEEPWVKPGDIAITQRYEGIEIDWPPGSGDKYRLLNDERVLGVIKK